jgi:transcriptional regulator with XRE-family HTH domain
MCAQKVTTHEKLMEIFQKDPEFRKQQRMVRPYYRIAAEIINLRNKLHLTQKELAKRGKTHQTRISKIESSELDIRLSTLIELAEALECQLVINFMPYSEPVIQEAGEPYKSLFAKATSQLNTSPVVFVSDENKYQPGPVMAGINDQCN